MQFTQGACRGRRESTSPGDLQLSPCGPTVRAARVAAGSPVEANLLGPRRRAPLGGLKPELGLQLP